MSLESDIALLASVDVLSDLTGDELRLLAFGSEHQHFGAGRTLYREGQHADSGLVIASGSVDLSRKFGDHDQVLRTVLPGNILGEMALITQTQRLTTATATQDTQIIKINRSLFRRMLDEYPGTAAGLHAKLSLRLVTFLNDIGRLESRFSDR